MLAPNILFEDADILVIDKPAGFVTNRADTTINQPTVQEWVGLSQRNAWRRRPAASGSETAVEDLSKELDFYKRAGIVHRLDKETSGLLIIAKNEESFVNLQRQFREGRVKKTYIALCHGEIKPSTGEINIPIGRLPWNRMRFGVLPQGRVARTRYRVISNFQFPISNFQSRNSKDIETLSLVEVYPETGRTHQIRVHMQYMKHPIFADELYTGRKISKRDRKLLPRHFLHASRIVFDHPRTGERVEFESPLPPDLKEFLNALKSA